MKDQKPLRTLLDEHLEVPAYLTHLYANRETLEALAEIQDIMIDHNPAFESRSKVVKYLITLVRDNPSILKKYSHKKYKII